MFSEARKGDLYGGAQEMMTALVLTMPSASRI